VVTRNRRVAKAALAVDPGVTHGDLQITHVLVDDDDITGVVNLSEAGQGDVLDELASLTLGHKEHLGDVVAGYGTPRRPRRDPRVVVAALPARDPLAGRARLRPVARGRGVAIPHVRPHETDGHECCSARRMWPTASSHRYAARFGSLDAS
jgi:hypothetical protein